MAALAEFALSETRIGRGSTDECVGAASRSSFCDSGDINNCVRRGLAFKEGKRKLMKCFYHGERDAVGTCSQCGKAVCRDCVEDVGGALLCKGCMVLRLQEHEVRKEGREEARKMTQDAAQRKIRASKMLFVVVAALALLIGIAEAFASLGDPQAPPFIALVIAVPFGSIFTGYLLWSCYWGIPAIWNRWWGMFRRVGCFLIANPVTWLILIVALFEIPVFAGYLYGVFGGGVYEYRKCLRIAEGRNSN